MNAAVVPDMSPQAEIRSLGVLVRTTRELRSISTHEITRSFIGTDCKQGKHSVRHAFFAAADEQNKNLQRAPEAEIDEDAWASLYSSVSRLFDTPSTGKNAVKVINDYGDEVLKVYEVRR